MNELEAVNVLLSTIGESEINTLTLGHPDVANARKTLDRARQRILRKGWWFNRDYNVILTPDTGTNKILVRNILSMEIDDTTIVKRGDYLYNRLTQSDQFTAPVTLYSCIRYLDWDILPDSVTDAITYAAAAEFVRDELEDPNKEAALREDARLAMIELKSEDINTQQYNVFNRPHTRRARAGVQPYGGTIQRFSGTPDR